MYIPASSYDVQQDPTGIGQTLAKLTQANMLTLFDKMKQRLNSIQDLEPTLGLRLALFTRENPGTVAGTIIGAGALASIAIFLFARRSK